MLPLLGDFALGFVGRVVDLSLEPLQQTLEKAVNVTFLKVSYKTSQQGNTDVIGGNVDAQLVDAGGAVPLIRTGPKGSGQFTPISWDEALDRTAKHFLEAERRYGPETIWPYYYAGTMGLVMRDGINRLRHVKRYSGQYSTICTALAWAGWLAGHGRLTGGQAVAEI